MGSIHNCISLLLSIKSKLKVKLKKKKDLDASGHNFILQSVSYLITVKSIMPECLSF